MTTKTEPMTDAELAEALDELANSGRVGYGVETLTNKAYQNSTSRKGLAASLFTPPRPTEVGPESVWLSTH